MRNADQLINDVLSVMKYDTLYELNNLWDCVIPDSFGDNEEMRQFKLVMDGMLDKKLITVINKVSDSGIFAYVDPKQLPASVAVAHYKLTIHGERIKQNGGWIKHQQSRKNELAEEKKKRDVTAAPPAVKKLFSDSETAKFIAWAIGIIAAVITVIQFFL